MLRPSMPEIIGPNGDAYSFVVAVAKRAREIAEETEEKNEPLEEKPVRVAVDEFAAGKCRYEIVEGRPAKDAPQDEPED